jgi:hypothetical protein
MVYFKVAGSGPGTETVHVVHACSTIAHFFIDKRSASAQRRFRRRR